MRILLCSNTFEHIHHGPAKFANFILEINHMHPPHEVRILTEDVAANRLGGLPQVYKMDLRIPFFLRPVGQFMRMFKYYSRARQIEQEFAYDVIVFNNAFIGLWAALVGGKPTIGMINDEKNLMTSLAGFRGRRSWLKQYLFRFFEKTSAHHHRGIITNSDFLRKRVMEGYRVPEERVKRLYKAIDLSENKFKPERKFGNPIRVLFVKADFRIGKLDVLVQALRRLRRYDFYLTVIGPGKEFEKQVRDLGRGAENIQLNYSGPQPQRVVFDCLQSHDIFCVPSATEALGVANIEALACGIPVISTHTGGVPEVLDYGNNGWLVEPGDAAGLANAIEQCINSPQQRLEKAASGRAFVQRFSKDNMFTDFLAIVDELCGY